MTVKTITIKKRGGGTRKQKVKVLSSGKFKFIKNSATSVKRIKRRGKIKLKMTRTKRVIRKVSVSRTMARRKRSAKRTSRSSGMIGQAKRFAKPIAIGLGITGLASIAGSAIGQPALGQNKLVNALGAFALGGPVAGGAALLLGGGLSNLFGGSNGSMEGLA